VDLRVLELDHVTAALAAQVVVVVRAERVFVHLLFAAALTPTSKMRPARRRSGSTRYTSRARHGPVFCLKPAEEVRRGKMPATRRRAPRPPLRRSRVKAELVLARNFWKPVERCHRQTMGAPGSALLRLILFSMENQSASSEI